jgi:hypothetical protein
LPLTSGHGGGVVPASSDARSEPLPEPLDELLLDEPLLLPELVEELDVAPPEDPLDEPLLEELAFEVPLLEPKPSAPPEEDAEGPSVAGCPEGVCGGTDDGVGSALPHAVTSKVATTSTLLRIISWAPPAPTTTAQRLRQDRHGGAGAESRENPGKWGEQAGAMTTHAVDRCSEMRRESAW